MKHSLRKVRLLLDLSRSQDIARRYFVTNGFDGALTMLGLCMGFRVSGEVNATIAITACLGAAVALGVSGLTSAYVSESAERQKALADLEQAMIADLEDSMQGVAARLVPRFIAIVNGAAPLCISLIIIAPLWLDQGGIGLFPQPLDTSIALAFVVIFLLGVFLGRVSGVFWLWSGLKTLLIGGVTAALILVVGQASGG